MMNLTGAFYDFKSELSHCLTPYSPRLVERVRRESKMASRTKNICKIRLRTPELRVKLLERRQYLKPKREEKARVCKHVSTILAGDVLLWRRRRLTRPTTEEEENSRNTAGLPSHVFVTSPRRVEKLRQEEERRTKALDTPNMLSGQIIKATKNDNTSSLKKVPSSNDVADIENATSLNNIDCENNGAQSSPTRTNILKTREETKLQCRVSPETALPHLVNNISHTKSLIPKSKHSQGTVSKRSRSSEDFWVLEQSDTNSLNGDVRKCQKDSAFVNNTRPVETMKDIDPIAHFLEAKEVLEEDLEGCDLFWPKGDQSQSSAFVEGRKAPPVETLQSKQSTLADVRDIENSAFKKFRCADCGKELNTKNGLDYHMRTHSGAHPFQCEICLKRFKSSSLCSRHRQIHSSDKKFSCKICGKGFAQKSNLSKHMDIHAGVRPFQVHSILTVT